ncbi:flagellar M-ring protein FliF [Paenibacillus phyllosphaerae]|uniref:Flagellar M-ring protein n=1 Tax=Paenibacillus phyllosphaerae TaxID=274593 RepID=A0A7W5AVD0_9BACL|nr:flagellar M-ring protein FliF [Paenibacillus phyllosphaerae]
MNETFNQYRAKVAQYWTGMGKKQKIWLGATTGVLIISIVLLTMVFSKTQYELAFQDLDTTDAAAVMEYLDSSGIPYELANGGKNILVPAANAEKVKVEAGSQGLVQNGSIGFEAFSTGSSPFGSTDREFDVKYRSALNGEIQRLLNGMQGVQKSNVLVNLPEESAFLSTEDEEQASASIMITFKSGYRPTQKEVDGYYNLVKTAVPKLAVENITISSAEGELTASNEVGGTGDSSMTVETHFQIQKKYENDLKRNIQQFLSPIVGMDSLVVSVTSSFNFDKKKTDESLVTPLENNNNNGIIVSEQTNSSTSTGSSGAGGVAGTGSTDVPTYQSSSTGDSSSSEESSRTTNYEVNRINNQIESGPYVIKDLSISIAVDKSKLNDESKAEITTFLASLVRSQLAESGQDVNDDTLIAKKVSLMAQTFTASDDASASSGISMTMAIGIGAAALVIIGGLALLLIRRRKKAQAEAMIQEEIITPTKIDYATIDMEMTGNDNQMRKQLESLAKNKPEEFVNLLRTWLADE